MTTTQKPILFLDVDGVLNAFAPVRPHTVHKIGGRTVKGVFMPYTINFDNEVVDMIDALAEHFEIVWATMWNAKANEQVAPVLGIEPFPTLFCDHNDGWDEAVLRGTPAHEIHRLWYAKTPLIPAYAGTQPFAWVDDDHSGADRDWLATHCDAEHFLLVRTNADTGLAWDDVAALITWAQNLASGSLTSPTAYLGVKATVPSLPLDYEPVLWLDNDEPLPAVYDEDYEISDEELHAFLAKLEDEDA